MFLPNISSIGLPKIVTVSSVVGMAITAILEVVKLIPHPLMGIFAIGALVLIALGGFIADIKKETPSKRDYSKPKSVSFPKDLRIKEKIWRKLDILLEDIGFSERKRNDSEELMGESYEFSWASGGTSLLFVQLKPGELITDAIFQLEGIKSSLQKKRNEYDIKKLVIICDVEKIFDVLHHNIIGREDLALLTHYSINKIEERDAGIAHLKKLLL